MWRMRKDPVHTGRTLNAAVSSPSQDVKTPSKLLIHQGKQFVHWAFFFLGDSDTDICPVSLSLCVWVSGLASFLDSRCVSCGDDAHISSLADHVA